MTTVLDDMVSRPGSTVSLLRTVVGLYLRDAGGWMPARALLELMAALGAPAPQARTALSRVKQRGVLVAAARDGQPGFALADGARPMLERGDRRIDGPRSMGPGDDWCVIVFSVPEEERERRHQLRRRLRWVGCGTVSPGVWICPDFLRDEVQDILAELGLADRAVLFTTRGLPAAADLPGAIAQWWDLEHLAALHRGFLEKCSAVPATAPAPTAGTFADYVRCIDHWRVIPYLDPGLPPECLPADWPGAEGVQLFLRIRDTHAGPAAAFVRGVLAAGPSPELSPAGPAEGPSRS
ncbi:PaaX family transcriptional regulator [Kocuria rosea]|uniref:PaaX family transcriptional regulator n=1 Tax=Kocuria rosea TaxID=1275 RepID=UPI002041DDCF|nr:PaaX family transcriptional regulator C-terminal domain-containing protein [Kocuria rosea]MCM3687649.1 regulator [Kocuria rosea]